MASIRNATAEDCPTLTAMVRNSRAYEGEQRVMVAQQTIDEQYVRGNPTRVAVDDDGRLIGFYSVLVPGRGEPGEGEIDFMFVADDLQGRGIGRALADDLKRLAADLGIKRVHVVSHPPAEAFYRAIGGRPVGVDPPRGRITWSRPLLTIDIP